MTREWRQGRARIGMYHFGREGVAAVCRLSVRFAQVYVAPGCQKRSRWLWLFLLEEEEEEQGMFEIAVGEAKSERRSRPSRLRYCSDCQLASAWFACTLESSLCVKRLASGVWQAGRSILGTE